MVPCVIMGDSIAVGVGEHRPDCVTVAQSGITSERYVTRLLTRQDAQTIVISLGVNDDDTVDTAANLRQVRSAVGAQTVYWLLPGIKARAREAIRDVAAEHGDRLIDTREYAGRDHLHPSRDGYGTLAALTEDDAPSIDLAAAAEPDIPETYDAGGRGRGIHRFHGSARYRHLASFVRWRYANSFVVSRAGRHHHRHHHGSVLAGWGARTYRLASLSRDGALAVPASPAHAPRHGAHRTSRHAAQRGVYARVATCLRTVAASCAVVFGLERS